ncbi:aminotransferase class I/II-fold pyridoxal phosphate-dependent enzyme [Halorubrum sp. SD626R]|jgi:aspartate/methionine/tyrosine aminotransferase|uniref:aminotransferase class I/II-fold pyridoxal phosphate-dependent enzyme n=1 Tax=Halorubrum sp. SD626R TaxID=1419722 RepID=UPI000B2500FA|nr:aminotransferase class I/II-fold pyridoxal phosphate-dependent enzyme [Halorubrum sp. SD626R]TKX81548.1 aminotransferase class I/II-fold pyridoxal phosphate-dependent enzyme [Halorubrum sp. SD626R]
MRIDPFGLERWFAEYEHEADIMLAESGIRSLDASRFDLDPGKLDYVIPTNGDPEFRASVGDRYGRSADEVLFTCGTQEANFLTFLSLLGDAEAPDADPPVGSGTHAVVVTPTYQALHAVPDAFGEVTRVELEAPEWELDPAAIADAARDDTAVIVVNNPNNPTGRYHDEAAMRAVYDVAVDRDAYLLCDEVYRLLDDDPHPPVASFGSHGISTTSLTKAYGLAGLRFGWIAGPEAVVERAWRWKDYTTISPSLFGQHVAKQALGRREPRILEENRELAATNRAIVADWLDRHGLDWYDPVGVNGFVTVPDGFDDAEAFCRSVVETESVVLAPGGLFGFPGRFRIGFGLPTEELEEGLRRVSRVIEGDGESAGAVDAERGA